MGIENEYGITSAINTDPVTLSDRIVLAYAKHKYPNINIRWDYDVENPLRDARGFDLSRSDADFSLLTDEDQSIPNIVLPYGARFYVDHAHPEYSSPEVLTPTEVVKWDLAGERVMQLSVSLDSQIYPQYPIRIFKNNVDNKGASYGTHENYMTKRSIDFKDLVNGLTPHFVTRQIYCGAGRIGINQDSSKKGFQISQRADYIEAHVGLETTLRRPIINTRDEPHCDSKLNRRLHVIIGDGNMSDFATILKFGSTSLILSMIENDFADFNEVEIERPVEVIKKVSQDLDLEKIYSLTHGKKMSAMDIQWWYLEKANQYVKSIGVDSESKLVLDFWEEALTGLANDKHKLSDRIDWIAKQDLITTYIDDKGLSIDDPIVEAIDIKYSEITAANGIAQILRSNNRLKRYLTNEQIEDAIDEPPASTRAWFRGKVLSKFPDSVSAASWDSVILDLDKTEPLLRISTTDPLRGTKELAEEILESSNNVQELANLIRKNTHVN
jgi:proteasome accessory factor A